MNKKPFNDKMLTESGPLRRYRSLSETGIKLTDLPVTDEGRAELERWRNKISRVLQAKDRIKKEVRSTEGYRVDSDEALAGETECFRMHKLLRLAPIKIGINVSTDHSAWEIQAMRGGAVIAFVDLCKKQGRKVSIEVCYGNGLNTSAKTCHVRVQVEPYSSTLAHICLSNSTTRNFGDKLVDPLAAKIGSWWTGGYRIHEFEKSGVHEYDFVLDRIETPSIVVEEKRIMDRLIKLGVA